MYFFMEYLCMILPHPQGHYQFWVTVHDMYGLWVFLDYQRIYSEL